MSRLAAVASNLCWGGGGAGLWNIQRNIKNAILNRIKT